MNAKMLAVVIFDAMKCFSNWNITRDDVLHHTIAIIIHLGSRTVDSIHVLFLSSLSHYTSQFCVPCFSQQYRDMCFDQIDVSLIHRFVIEWNTGNGCF
jgi:hypothetical protein